MWLLRKICVVSCFVVSSFAYRIQISPVWTRPLRFCRNCQASRFLQNEYRCSVFQNVDLITGDAVLIPCRVCREDDDMCGIDGKFFFFSLNNTLPHFSQEER
jgi:hypothetical protein